MRKFDSLVGAVKRFAHSRKSELSAIVCGLVIVLVFGIGLTLALPNNNVPPVTTTTTWPANTTTTVPSYVQQGLDECRRIVDLQLPNQPPYTFCVYEIIKDLGKVQHASA
jgi:hypothetical protein